LHTYEQVFFDNQFRHNLLDLLAAK
jgi:hypothetical protein